MPPPHWPVRHGPVRRCSEQAHEPPARALPYLKLRACRRCAVVLHFVAIVQLGECGDVARVMLSHLLVRRLRCASTLL